MAAPRRKIPKETEKAVLLNSPRRCALCFGLDGDSTEKRGQIAHLDHNHATIAPENLCWLCQPHHDQYDSKTSQSKGLTGTEVRAFRDELYSTIPGILAITDPRGGPVDISANVEAGSGDFGPGGDARIEGGKGRHGASGGGVTVGPGNYRAGPGGRGKGGDLVIKGGDAE